MSMKTFGKLLLAASILTPATTLAGPQDVVTDQDNKKVYSTFGDCVRTKWESSSDECAGTAQPTVQERRKSIGVSRSYIAFFDFNASSLTSNAKNIIASAVSNAKADSDFIVTGHADRVGSDEYNIKLSKRRAESVKAELSRLGVSGSRVTTQAKGESTPLVSTADGIREPQNRRVEIVYTK